MRIIFIFICISFQFSCSNKITTGKFSVTSFRLHDYSKHSIDTTEMTITTNGLIYGNYVIVEYKGFDINTDTQNIRTIKNNIRYYCFYDLENNLFYKFKSFNENEFFFDKKKYSDTIPLTDGNNFNIKFKSPFINKVASKKDTTYNGVKYTVYEGIDTQDVLIAEDSVVTTTFNFKIFTVKDYLNIPIHYDRSFDEKYNCKVMMVENRLVQTKTSYTNSELKLSLEKLSESEISVFKAWIKKSSEQNE